MKCLRCYHSENRQANFCAKCGQEGEVYWKGDNHNAEVVAYLMFFSTLAYIARIYW